MKAKRNPTPLVNLVHRHRGGPKHLVLQKRVQLLPNPVTLGFFIPGTPTAKSAPFPQWSRKLNRLIYIEDKKQVARAAEIRKQLLEEIPVAYPQVMPYLPLVVGSVAVYAHHLFPPPEDWYPGKQHLCAPDVDNLGKMVKDVPGARTKGLDAILYWDDCPVIDDHERKDYWDPTVEDPDYPQTPGSILLVKLSPPVWNPNKPYHCDWCGAEYVTESNYRKHRCPIY